MKKSPIIPTRILITGASSGIGAHLASSYARPGVSLLLMGRDGERLRSVALRCTDRGADVSYIIADVRDAQLLHQWIIDQDKKSPIDLVVANAGISGGPRNGIESPVQIQTIFDVNVAGVMNTIQPILPRMIARGGGQVALMASLAGFAPFPGAPAYAASKSAVKTYGLALRLSLRKTGVNVSVICPGFVDTPLTRVNPYKMPWLIDGPASAPFIVDGLSRNKPIIAFPRAASFVVRFIAVLPFVVQKIILGSMPEKPSLPSQ